MKVISDNSMEDYVTIQSFDFRTLQYLHKNYPAIKTAMLIEDVDKKSLEEQLKELGFNPTIYSPHFSLVTKEVIAKCHSKKILLIPWTVNEIAKINELISLGVDGLISDYPNLYFE